jgi:Tfp pilus assembly protein PilX
VQRVRIGLTGLAFVFILVLLGAVFSRQATDEQLITANGIEQQRVGGNQSAPAVNVAEPKEPLAELGVAPGHTADDNRSATDRQLGQPQRR